MRVVFDTNIFVSALVLPGSRGEQALLRVVEGRDQLVFSRAILDELLEVLARKFARNAEELSRVALFLDDLGEIVEPGEVVTALADDADNRILECALAGGADLVVTGDKAMLALGSWRGVRILTLAGYVST